MSKTDETKGEYNVALRKREQAVMKRYAAIQKASEDKIGCQKIYVDIAGGISDAFVLDELIFFTLPRPETGKSGLRVWKEGMLWMAVSRSEWWDRKRLTAKEADGAIERLLKRNLIFKDHFLFNKQNTTHLRLNVSEFFKQYFELIEKQNPPEDEGDTILKDISDLYAMMGMPDEDTPQEGIPVKDTPEGIPEKVEGIPVKDKASLNGDFINSPHTPSTQPSHTPIINPTLDLFAGYFGKFLSKKELDRWTILYEAAGSERAEELAEWAFKKEIHMTNRGGLLDSLETAAKNWKEKPARTNGRTPKQTTSAANAEIVRRMAQNAR